MINYFLSDQFIVFSLLDLAGGSGKKPNARLSISKNYCVRDKEFKICLQAC